MGSFDTCAWEPERGGGLTRRDRRGGQYHAYVPDLLATRSLIGSSELGEKAAAAERTVRLAYRSTSSTGLDGISRFLLRSEAIASSLIEGIAPSPQQVALAELAQQESAVKGFSAQARLVANNITVLRRATDDLVQAARVDVADIVELHAALLPDERWQGIRVVQNWIGGSNWHPLDAEFIPPVPARVSTLMDDLVLYLGGSLHAPLIQAALVHAQFETIHPFVDGNGRVGRALIHTVLARRGLSESAMLPVSLVLSTLRERYVAGLTAYRFDGASHTPTAAAATELWIETFLDACLIAADQATVLATELTALRGDWVARLAHHRLQYGRRETPRSDSATARILAALAEAPIMTTATAQRVLGVSFPSARTALEELADAGVLQRKSVDRGATAYIAREILDLVNFAERRLASTQFDTRTAPPRSGVAAAPD